jgi:hypothetical protein
MKELRIKELENHTSDLKAKLSESQKIIESNNSSKKIKFLFLFFFINSTSILKSDSIPEQVLE